jgi:hypothetical protein
VGAVVAVLVGSGRVAERAAVAVDGTATGGDCGAAQATTSIQTARQKAQGLINATSTALRVSRIAYTFIIAPVETMGNT